jgi:hypothetical protein
MLAESKKHFCIAEGGVKEEATALIITLGLMLFAALGAVRVLLVSFLGE